MRYIPPSLSEHRRQRFHRWFVLVLRWFAAFLDVAEAWGPLSRDASALAHHWLDAVEHRVLSLVMLRAQDRTRRNGRPHVWRRHAHTRRAYLGSAVRRAVRSRDLRERIARLSQSFDALADLIVWRKPRGFTRGSNRRARYQNRGCARARASFSPAAASDTS